MAESRVVSPPSSPSVYPHSFADWQVALQAIKLLYTQRQYKQCAARVSEVLRTAPEPIHAVHKTFLYFYSAISYEAMGLSAHNYSRNKLPLLHLALESFVTCSAVLPGPIPAIERYSNTSEALFTSIPSDSSSYCDSPGSRTRPSSLASSLADMIERSLHYGSAKEDPFISHDSGDESGQSHKKLCTEILASSASHSSLVPSPLNTDDSSALINRPAVNKVGTNKIVLARAHPLPLIIDTGHARPSSPDPGERADAASHLHGGQRVPPYPTEYSSHISNFNSSIRSLQAQINSSIARNKATIEEVTEMQLTRRRSKSVRRSASFWSFSPINEKDGKSASSAASCPNSADKSSGQTLVTESMDQRIQRLRSEGWQTVGIKSRRRGWKGEEYYRAYCARILGELYLTEEN
ncbi:uncharacterized protein BP01DRAFT_332042 [Aspergillus saccharolyticus JOP 1030-1]|uniref:Uncharacterized protein n=1 Tax=Aspergillus saccharolyticus JOP 1030-1 TaxID=1450539 RepID=A0A318ZXZ0_9EURO|nr:hypothetical protein BP01DRAFT_332042 [Aspergillus saccharolyticus JOP 1030-1]PYH49193.1 hypothetical protein BP01DRAFT_332042 [Aspergillus saccharolyticus JOP 1030-1]